MSYCRLENASTSREQFFCGGQKPQLALRGRDWVHLSVAFEPIGRIIRVQDCAEDGGKIGLLPDFWGCVVSVDLLAFNRTCEEQNTPFAAEIDHVGVDPARNFDIHPDIYTREGIKAAEG